MRNKMVFTRDRDAMNIHLKERPTSAQSPYSMCDLSAPHSAVFPASTKGWMENHQ